MASNVRITGDALLAEQASFARRRRETQEGVALELDAASYLGSSELFIDRALARYRGG
jgi:hypothetical protein